MSASSTSIRLGIVGGGFMGRRHVEIVGQTGLAEVSVIADPFSDALARDYDVAHVGTIEEVLRHGVDAVIVANPNAQHVPTTVACLEADIPVLVEKPLATSAAECEVLVKVCDELPAPVLVGHHRRHHPAVEAARHAISSGAIGDVVAVNAVWLARKADVYFGVAWRCEPGAGVVMINAVHDLDLLRNLCGEVDTVAAHFSSRQRGLQVADTATVSLEFSSGALGTYICSDAAVSPYTWDQATKDEPAFPFTPDASCYVISGTKGSLTVPSLELHYHNGVADWNHSLSSSFLLEEEGDSFSRQLRHFCHVVRREVEPLVTVRDAARTINLMDAVLRSAVSGSRVDVS